MGYIRCLNKINVNLLNIRALIFIGFLFLNSIALSQLGNLTTQQVGTEGLLMGGALVAAESNNAGLFYNPASISSSSLFSFSFNTSVYRMQFLNFQDAFGPDTEFKLTSSRFESPFFSMMLPMDNKYNVKLGFGTFSRFNVDYNFFNRIVVDDPFPELNHSDGVYEGDYSYTLKSSEQWIVFDASKRLSDKFLIGASVIVAVRSLTYIEKISTGYTYRNEIDQQLTNASFRIETNAYMYDYKLLFKFGGIYKMNKKNRFGLTFTTSSISVLNNARNFRSIEQTNIDDLLDDPEQKEKYQDLKVSNFANGLKGRYKSPINIAAGYDRHINNDLLSFSVDFVGKIQPYLLIDGEGETDELINTADSSLAIASFLNMSFGQRAIVNFSVGYNRELNEKFILMLGFRTNFSATKDLPYTQVEELQSITDIVINQYHLSGGITFTFLKNKFILGTDIGFSFGKNNDNFVNFSEPSVLNDVGIPLRGNIEPIMKQSIVSLGFVFGYSVAF